MIHQEIYTGSKTSIQIDIRERMHLENTILSSGTWSVKLPLTQLKEMCTTTPFLAYADFTKPFKLHTDTSVLGFECCPVSITQKCRASDQLW